MQNLRFCGRMFLKGNFMKINNLNEIGQLIRKTRKEQGLLQKDLALAAGTGIRLIIELENGKRGVKIDTVIRICKLLGLSINIE